MEKARILALGPNRIFFIKKSTVFKCGMELFFVRKSTRISFTSAKLHFALQKMLIKCRVKKMT